MRDQGPDGWFLKLGTSDTWKERILCSGHGPVLCRALAVAHLPTKCQEQSPSCSHRNVSRHYWFPLGDKSLRAAVVPTSDILGGPT